MIKCMILYKQQTCWYLCADMHDLQVEVLLEGLEQCSAPGLSWQRGIDPKAPVFLGYCASFSPDWEATLIGLSWGIKMHWRYSSYVEIKPAEQWHLLCEAFIITFNRDHYALLYWINCIQRPRYHPLLIYQNHTTWEEQPWQNTIR